MTTENRKGMKDIGTSNLHIDNAETLQLKMQVTLSKTLSETIAAPMICTLQQHGFLAVFSNNVIWYSNNFCSILVFIQTA